MLRAGIYLVFMATAAGSAAQSAGELATAAKRVIDNRCVACHACYNAPCQLDLSSFEGIARGATDQRIYLGTRFKPAEPTRLGIDAHGEAEWRKRGFFSVLDPLDGDSPAFSLLGRILALKRAYPERRDQEAHDWMCPASAPELAVYSTFGYDGMPHGFPQLDDDSYAAIVRWLSAGARVLPDPVPALAPMARSQLDGWERLLNNPDPRHRLVARYLYEHLFIAHVYLKSSPSVFFRLVRSATAAPEPVNEIATVRPYDDPGMASFYYRFVPIKGTLVHKTHITFELSPERLERYRRWFLGGSWKIEALALPGYDPVSAANPFKTFEALPAIARYRFFLDNARYFVMTFIRGPVCEGQMAVNVINDHFQVLFLDPFHDLSVTDPAYLLEAEALLDLPAAGESDPFETYYFAYKKRQRAYTAFREQRYSEAYPRGMDINGLWDGAKTDRNAALTVVRHFDNAAVVHGLRGGMPKTLWVMDYPIFERIYYLLVTGFNVYGNAFHQASTRLYMDNLRVESEDLFLSFLPPATRKELRGFWYRGMLAQFKMEHMNPLRGADRPTSIVFGDGNPKSLFLEKAKARLGGALPHHEFGLNVSLDSARDRAPESSRADVEKTLNRLTGGNAPFVAAMPDLSYLLVEFEHGNELYALIRNKAHLNVSFLLAESNRRVPEEDTMSVLRGVAGSYPNFIFSFEAAQTDTFVKLMQGWTNSSEDRHALYNTFGASRYRSDFWKQYDRLNDAAMSAEGLAGARLDLSKYAFR